MVRLKSSLCGSPEVKPAVDMLRDFFDACELSVEVDVLPRPEGSPFLVVTPSDPGMIGNVMESLGVLQEELRITPAKEGSFFGGSVLSQAFLHKVDDAVGVTGFLLPCSHEIVQQLSSLQEVISGSAKNALAVLSLRTLEPLV